MEIFIINSSEEHLIDFQDLLGIIPPNLLIKEFSHNVNFIFGETKYLLTLVV